MSKLSKYYNARELAIYIRAVLAKTPWLWIELFPAKKQISNDLSFLRGANGLPVALTQTDTTVQATPLSVQGLKELVDKLPSFKNSMPLDGDLLIRLKTAMDMNKQDRIDAVLLDVFKQFAALYQYAMITCELLMCQALGNGIITMPSGRQIDYKLDASQKETLTGAALWAAADTSTPVDDLIRWMATMPETPTRCVMGKSDFANMCKNTAIRAELAKNNPVITANDVKAFVESKTGLKIFVHEKRHKNAAGNTVYLWPAGKVVLLPAEPIGEMRFGQTNEETMLDELQDVVFELVGPADGIALLSFMEVNPPLMNTIISMITAPSGENMHNIFIGTVA